MNPIPDGARPAIREAPDSWQNWLAICDEIAGDDVELTIEEFAPFSELFNLLLACGVPFDERFVASVRRLQASIVNTDDDTDMDGHDNHYRIEDGYGSDGGR
jgi:hypothetical protein